MLYSTSELRKNLLGCLEIALFMKAGPERFSNSPESLKRSFLIPIIALPLSLAGVLYAHPEGALDSASMSALGIVYVLRLFVYLAVFLGLVYMMASKMNRLDSFYRFATANNWLALPAAALMLPLTLMFMAGHYEFSEIYPLMVFITLYSYAYTAFMATHVLRVPAELACFIAIAGMAINQTALHVIKFVAANALIALS